MHNFSSSLGGFAAGPWQDLDHPLGIGGGQLHEWVFSPTAAETGRRFLDAGRALDGRECVEFAPSASVIHVRLRHGGAVFDTMGT